MAAKNSFKKQNSEITHFLSTGCTILDLAIAGHLPGGLPAGRVIQIYGGESTGKSMVAAEVAGSAQRAGGKCDYDDTEGSLDMIRAEALHGVTCKTGDKWWYGASQTVNELFDKNIKRAVTKALASKKPSAYICDTATTLPSKEEATSEIGGEGTGYIGARRAGVFSTGFKKYMGPIRESNLGVIFIDQVRDNVGVTFGEKDMTPGGRAIKFYASVRLRLSHVERIKNSAGKVIGVKVGFFTRKNKISAPFRDGTFRIMFDYGIDDVASSLEWIYDNDPTLKASWEATKKKLKKEEKKVPKKMPWDFPVLDIKGATLYACVDKIEAADKEDLLTAYVEELWNIVYAPLPRKKRSRT